MPFGAPHYPIVYVRGFAMTESERNETAADPFCGFNLGSTTYRASSSKDDPVRKFIFESPVVRLAKDFGYSDVFENGLNIDEDGWAARLAAKQQAGSADSQVRENSLQSGRSITIYRYYDEGSTLFGDGKTDSIKEYAQRLSELVLLLKKMTCDAIGPTFNPNDFKCYIVAHSMGGLITRCFLQNDSAGSASARKCVDKVFTYATPHNGIDVAGANVPGWLNFMDINNFSHSVMKDYLDLDLKKTPVPRVDYLPESKFPSDRFFCLIGTNRNDYDAGMGLSRTFAGRGSDGLVRIENASVWGIDDNFAVTKPAASAFVYKSHSGRFGIVNSEEGYQNLTRFLFGNVKIEIWLHIDRVNAPTHLADKKIEALYQFELEAGPRGKRWQLTRRVAEEDSTACRTHEELTGKVAGAKYIYLSTVFLSNTARVNPNRKSLAYGMSIGCRVPEYKADNKYWLDQYYEGTNLFQEGYVFEAWPPETNADKWKFKYGKETIQGQEAQIDLEAKPMGNGVLEMRIPFDSDRSPGIAGTIVISLSEWK
jgi:hypothetical protein